MVSSLKKNVINDKRLDEGQWFLRGSVFSKWHLSGLIPRVPCGALTTISPPPPDFWTSPKREDCTESRLHTAEKRSHIGQTSLSSDVIIVHVLDPIFCSFGFFFIFSARFASVSFFFLSFFLFFLRNEYYKNRIQLAQPTLSSIMKWRDICTYAYWRFRHLVNSWP